MDDRQLEERLCPSTVPVHRLRPERDWAMVHRKIKRAGVTLLLLWMEYKPEQPDGYQYSQFCLRYRSW
jgi:transposase